MQNTQPAKLPATSFYEKILLAGLTGILTLIVLFQANPGVSLPDRDYGIFAYIGQQIVLGRLPYKDAWDHKPPAIFYVDALGLWMAHGLRWGIWAIEFVLLFAAIWMSYALLKKLWGVLPALFGVAIWTIGLSATLEGGNTTEEFPLAFHFLALILFLRLFDTPDAPLDNILIGLSFGISFLFRANNAMIETAIVLLFILFRILQRDFMTIFRQLAWMGIGALLPILGTAAYFWRQGILKDMYDASITYNVIYSETKFSNTSGAVAGFQVLGIPAWIGLIGYIIVLVLLFQQWRAKAKFPPSLLLLLIAYPMALSLSDPAQRNYAHYFINWLPLIALLSGLFFYTLQNNLIPALKKIVYPETIYLGAALLILIAFLVFSGQAIENWKTFSNLIQRTDVERVSVISAYVKDNTQPGDFVLFWGGFPGENLMSRRASPSAYITYPLLLDSNLSEGFSDQFFTDITRNRPALIVDMDYAKALSIDPKKRAVQLANLKVWPYLPANITEVLKFIDDNYRVEATFRNATVYRLNP
jgi:hypothetical protein